MTIFPKIQFMDPEEQQKARKALLEYCCLDTFAMVKEKTRGGGGGGFCKFKLIRRRGEKKKSGKKIGGKERWERGFGGFGMGGGGIGGWGQNFFVGRGWRFYFKWG